MQYMHYQGSYGNHTPITSSQAMHVPSHSNQDFNSVNKFQSEQYQMYLKQHQLQQSQQYPSNVYHGSAFFPGAMPQHQQQQAIFQQQQAFLSQQGMVPGQVSTIHYRNILQNTFIIIIARIKVLILVQRTTNRNLRQYKSWLGSIKSR